MTKKSLLKTYNLILFVLPFIIWIYCFRLFLGGRIGLTSDAISYYDHTKFFIENLARGIYPLWDPNWHFGSPNEFFLRRLGSFNPAYLFPAALVKCGVSFFTAYMAFLSLYYLLGCLGFYALAKELIHNKIAAYAGFLLILFSSLGTRLFDSFLILEFVPLAWFFVSFIWFFKFQKISALLGMTLSAMVLMTTYIPFYFINILIVFVFCFLVLYPKVSWMKLRGSVVFIGAHKILTLFCLCALVISLIPGVRMFKESGKGEIALSKRHSTSDSANAASVGKKTATEWGIEEDLFYSYSFRDLTKFKFAIFYIPVFFYLLLGVGILGRISKLLMLLFVYASAILIIFSPYAPVYHFLHKHVFYFNLFRNLHFYLWWAILPTAILFACELLRLFLEIDTKSLRDKMILGGFIIVIHGIAFKIADAYHYGAATTNITILLSCLSFLAYHCFLSQKFKQSWIFSLCSMIVLLAVIALQPAELYKTISINSNTNATTYLYDQKSLDFSYVHHDLEYYFRQKNIDQPLISQASFHYAVKWFEELSSLVDERALYGYLYHKFIGYDSEPTLEGVSEIDHVRDTGISKELIEGQTGQFEVVRYSANSVQVKTNFAKAKFLVYNDNFHSGWRAIINNQMTPLIRANHSFKGVWVPSGKQDIKFIFGSKWDYWINGAVLFIFYLVFILLIIKLSRFKPQAGIVRKGMNDGV